MDIKCYYCESTYCLLTDVIMDWNVDAEPIKKTVCFRCLLKKAVN